MGKFLFIAAMLLVGCGPEAPPAPRASADGSAARGNPDRDLTDGEFANEFGDQVDGPDGGDFTEVNTDETKSLDDILAECGNIDFDHPTDTVLDTSLTGARIVQEGSLIFTNYRVTVDPVLSIQSSVVQSVNTVDFHVVAEPFLAQSFAEDEVAPRRGTTTMDLYPREERSAQFEKDSAWDGIVCTVQPVYRTISNLGQQNVVVEFEPALPSSITPTADAIRYAEEWQNGPRTWNNIKATVAESTIESMPIGSEYTGSVTIRQIDANFSVVDGEGVAHNVQADIAFEMRSNFGDPATTNALGVRPVTRFYIDHTGRTFAAIQSDIADGETPVATFFGPGAK